MIAKKKNKKAHKPPNPNPPQSLEKPSKPEEKVQEIEPKSEVKEEQTITPEVCSEVVVTPVSDVKDIESETPKKPKRNKGKKKKQDKNEELMENLPEKQGTQSESSANVQEPVRELIAEDKGNEEKKGTVDEDDVVPSARKKKNKNKSQEKLSEESKILDEVSVPVLKKIPSETTAIVSPEIQELFSTAPETPKQDAKKKKNKKKNRTDSEKSDKSENVMTCTSAFQSLLQQDEMLMAEKTDVNAEDTKEIKTNISLDNTEKTSEIVKNVETVPIGEIKEEPQNAKNLSKEESKSRKKNKKDKKQSQTEIVPVCPLEVPLVEDDALTQKVPHSEPREVAKEFVDIPIDTNKEMEPSPKPKAKFAKPVEKKRKGKLDAQSSENVSNIDSTETVKEGKNDVEISTEPELTLEEISTVNIVELQSSDQTTQKSSAVKKNIENISVPSDHTMGKKRKKSPKPQKSTEAHTATEVLELPEKIQSEKEAEVKECALILSDLIQPATQFTSSKLEEVLPKIIKAPLKETLTPRDDTETNLVEAILFESPLPPEKRDDEGFETKTSKKKKKTPKVPQAEITSEVKEPKEPTDIKKTEVYAVKSKLQTEEKTDVSLDVPISANLEVQSARTDSETSSLDVIPDILFLRSSSQHLLDNNNNTVIQELLYVDEIKLNDPLLIPLIEGSGETPTPTPEPISFGIRMTEMDPKTLTDEKTDIKSKMMEVNQDMEELRLSIERSLAEFTALEKNDESEIKCEGKNVMKKEDSPINEKNNEAPKVEQTTIATESQENIPAEVHLKEPENLSTDLQVELSKFSETPPVCPTRKDNKGKSKSKKKGKQETNSVTPTATGESNMAQPQDNAKEEKQEKSEQKSEQKSESTQEKGKQQSTSYNTSNYSDNSKDIKSEQQPMSSELTPDSIEQTDFDPIENFEDALTSSIDDVNKTFEMIVKNVDDENVESQKKLAANKPEISVTEATDDKDSNRNEKVNPVSQPKNLLGQIDIPVQSNKTDYKKEKNKTPNARQARVKIKDSMDIQAKKQSKECQTDGKTAKKISDKSVKESFSKVRNDNEEYVYKYSFRKVFLQSACQVCNKDLKQVRMPCGYCNLVFYCGSKHKDEDWPQHQALCFAVSTLAHMKDQKHVYADAQHATGQDYRLLRMQMIVSCEKVLKRRLVPWEQEAMLYPRICADVACREWRQSKLKDCDGCGQLSYCAAHPEHLPKSHSRWCKSYSLYTKLVSYQQTKGRLEPHLPTKVLKECDMPGKMNEVLAAMYEEKIDMNDIQYASLTQVATAPLTAAYCLQQCRNATGITNGVHKKQPFTIHVVGAELQFEADALNKWETFFLHLRPDVEVLRVVLVSSMLNPGNLPLDLLGRIKLCDDCKQNKRSVVFKFEDNKNYFEYRCSEDFIYPDIICAFNPSIQRSSIYNGKDPWPATINSILKLKQPFVVTSYTLNELRKDIARVKEVADMDFKLVLEAGFNNFASVRPDRNFISDDEIPLLFKNYCVAVVLGC